ncbi:MAG: acetyl-CoA carboxylase biotin carboxyl carrier protein subunit [Candidatus Thermofonsia Clade 1 bacterium]|jgi:biotin carboxyl carrier protein|uniref:Acetyl-CoA carboxylase biotin carboxyl carrier protein subunit n=1 Tax=Candidatus Thermofonsia Clade 1 bacterium TaxID=2364210 RepID=A0A2M8PXF2_9CHLR|nr:MAG: acetyl-CoA carboxylase biotin carboxyl carrier protein subunit [Candidatus Thermofonsia Clade 1 bacterium]PJF42228.1 MAG: acetyl-CoA carboxylase biotin carboxyl carrier protein subunit [Candidatus Thermofonsia Clade 1 bacterium]RMF53908.1 MAG: biotin/lipoyl-binding protein [Chloroflexota bacterium]
MKYLATVNGQKFEIELDKDGRLLINGQAREVDFRHISEALYSALINNKSVEALVERQEGRYQVLIEGDLYEVEVLDERQQRLMSASSGFSVAQGEITVRSPMPGLIVTVRVGEGDHVRKGQALVVLESMKMENEIKAPRDGKVERIHVEKGQAVEQNQALITLS